MGPPVLAAAADLPAGHVLRASDLTPVAMPEDLAPAGALVPSEADRVAGRRLSGAVRAGEVVTDVRLGGPGLLGGQRPGTVAIALPVLPASAALVHPGDEVVVLVGSTDPLTGAMVPADDTPGLDVPGADVPGADVPGADVPGADVPGADATVPRAIVLDVPTSAAAGALVGMGTPTGDAAVVLAVRSEDATRLASAAASGAPVVLALLP